MATQAVSEARFRPIVPSGTASAWLNTQQMTCRHRWPGQNNHLVWFRHDRKTGQTNPIDESPQGIIRDVIGWLYHHPIEFSWCESTKSLRPL